MSKISSWFFRKSRLYIGYKDGQTTVEIGYVWIAIFVLLIWWLL